MTDSSDTKDGDFPATNHLPEPFEDDYERLANEIAFLHGRWKRFIKLFGAGKRRVELLNETAPVFFADLQDTYLDAIILGIVRLLDSPTMGSDENLVLKQLIRRAREVGDDDLAEDLSDQFDDIENHCDRLETWRHKNIAHLDRDVQHKKVEGESPLPDIPRKTFEEAFVLIERFMNMVKGYYGESRITFDLITSWDAGAVVGALKKAVDYDDAVEEGILSPLRLHRDSRFSDA